VIGSSHSPKEEAAVPLSRTGIPEIPPQGINESIDACPTLG
jgi:hypothetical protein